MTRSARDDGWGLVGAGRLDRPSEDEDFPKLTADEIQSALDGLLTGPALEAGKVALLAAWQCAAHDAAWRESKAPRGRSRETIRSLDVAFRNGRYREAREILAKLNEMTALHIEVRSRGRVSFGAKGKKASAFTMLELQFVRVAVRSLVADPPKEFLASKHEGDDAKKQRDGGPRRVFPRRFLAELIARCSILGLDGSEALSRKVYARLRKKARLQVKSLLPARRDLERPDRWRKPPSSDPPPPGMRRGRKIERPTDERGGPRR